MRINDIVLETKIAEAPQGMLKRAGLGIMSKFGSDKATGKLETGKIANALMRDFNRFLGQTKLEPDADAVLRFLQSKGYPSDGAKSILDQEVSKAPSGPMGGGPMGKMAGAAMDKLKSLGQGGTENPQTQNKIDPTMGEPGADADGDGKPDVAGGMSKAGQDAATAASANGPDSPANLQRLAGNAPKDAAGGVIPKGDAPLTKQQQDARKAEIRGRRQAGQSIGTLGGDTFRKGIDDIRNRTGLKAGMYTEEALPQSIIDKAFMQAAHDAAKMGYGLDPNTGNITSGAPTGPNASGGQDQEGGILSKAAQGFKQGYTGQSALKPGSADPEADKQGNLNVQQLSQLLPGVDPAKLKQATNMALSGGRLGPGQLGVLGQAFVELLKADPQSTTKAMAILKRVQA
jgi:hypothetical protein